VKWNGTVPFQQYGTVLCKVFGSDKNEKLNASIFCSVLELHDRAEQPNPNFISPNQNQT
jgi:hypothetical protein